MTIDDFRRAAETWGADIDRWPEEVRGPARRLAGTPEGIRILERERRIDVRLAAAPVVDEARVARASDAVLRRMPEARPRRRDHVRRLPRFLVPMTSVACAAAFGLLLAVNLPFAAGRIDAAAVLRLAVDSAVMTGSLDTP